MTIKEMFEALQENEMHTFYKGSKEEHDAAKAALIAFANEHKAELGL